MNNLFELAVALATEAVEVVRDCPHDPESSWIETELAQLADTCGMIPLGNTERAMLARSILGQSELPSPIFRLCDKATGEPVDYCPDSTFEDISEVQLANAALDQRGLAWRSETEIAEVRALEQVAERERTRWQITDEERQAINKFATANGRMWKHKLRLAWAQGNAPEPLQYLASHRCFGLDGLDRYRVIKNSLVGTNTVRR